MKRSSDTGYFRQLCTLDMAAPALIPAAIEELVVLLQLDMCCFNWVGSNGELSHAHTAGLIPTIDAVEHYTTRYVNQDEIELGITTRQRAHRPQIISGSKEMGRGFSETILYNDILKPIGLRHIVTAGVFTDGKLIATLTCNRMHDQREFSATDYRQLSQILPYLAMAAREHESENKNWGELGERGILLVDTHGAIQHADSLALNRLYRATRSSRYALDMPLVLDELLMQPLRELAQRLAAIENGEIANAPQIILSAEGRRFVLRARALRSNASDPLALIVVSIEEWVPGALLVLPWLRQQGLSLRQRELALHLMQGLTLAEAARAMNIKLATVQDYLDGIYTKLNVRSREALLLMLHTFNNANRIPDI